MYGDTSNLPGGKEPGDGGVVFILKHICLDTGWNTAHHVVTGGEYWHWFLISFHAQVGPSEFRNIRSYRTDVFWLTVGQVQLYVVFIMPSAAAFAHCVSHAATNNVTRS